MQPEPSSAHLRPPQQRLIISSRQYQRQNQEPGIATSSSEYPCYPTAMPTPKPPVTAITHPCYSRADRSLPDTALVGGMSAGGWFQASYTGQLNTFEEFQRSAAAC